MTSWITQLVEQASYFGVFALMVLENVFPPIPSLLVLPLAGFVSTQGQMSLTGAIIASTAGSAVGALPVYYLGYAIGEDRLRRWVERYGHWLAVEGTDVTKAQRWFERQGAKTVLICRFVPGVRTFIALPAGFARMNLTRFLIYTTIGSLIWNVVFMYAGVRLGAHYDRVERYVGPVSLFVLGAIAVAFVIRVVRLRAARRA